MDGYSAHWGDKDDLPNEINIDGFLATALCRRAYELNLDPDTFIESILENHVRHFQQWRTEDYPKSEVKSILTDDLKSTLHAVGCGHGDLIDREISLDDYVHLILREAMAVGPTGAGSEEHLPAIIFKEIIGRYMLEDMKERDFTSLGKLVYTLQPWNAVPWEGFFDDSPPYFEAKEGEGG